MLLLASIALIVAPSVNSIQLQCLNESSYRIGNQVYAVSIALSNFGFGPSLPLAYDVNGRQRSVSHMWASSNVTYACSFRMNGFMVTARGKIFKTGTENQVLFEDSTMCGPFGQVYAPHVFKEWNNFIKQKKTDLHKLTFHADVVVPTRMHWDDCFNHMSFQIAPLIGAVLEFHGDIWENLTWHASTYSAAMLNALGVPLNRIIVEEHVVARTLLLPWIPHWLPVQLASVRGIAKRTCELLTKSLIEMNFSDQLEPIKSFVVTSTTHPNDTAIDIINGDNLLDGMRYLVYLSRVHHSSRDVYNEPALLKMLTEIVDPTKVKVVVVGHSHAYPSVVMLQRSWQRFAKIFSRAIVMMGPHGGAWNNIMFTPSDCHYVEFNYLPDDPVYVNGSTQVRQCFLNAYWAKGGSGKFYNFEPTRRSPNLYQERYMEVSVRDAARILLLIDKDIPGGILRSNVVAGKFPHFGNPSPGIIPSRMNGNRSSKFVEALEKGKKALSGNEQKVVEGWLEENKWQRLVVKAPAASQSNNDIIARPAASEVTRSVSSSIPDLFYWKMMIMMLLLLALVALLWASVKRKVAPTISNKKVKNSGVASGVTLLP